MKSGADYVVRVRTYFTAGMLDTQCFCPSPVELYTCSGATFPITSSKVRVKNLTVKPESWNRENYFQYSGGVVMNEYFTSMVVREN